MSFSRFEKAFANLVAPVLAHLGFHEVADLEHWILPSKLYQRDQVWFGAESDERDGYVSITLGRLFHLRDVLPRVIVRGPFLREVTGQYEQLALNRFLQDVADKLPEALRTLPERWPLTPDVERDRWAQSEEGPSAYARYQAALGPEVTLWPPEDPRFPSGAA